MNGNGQWAKVPEWVAYKGLDATAWNILIVMAAKAGHDRVAWISNRTIADRLTAEGSPIRRRGVGKAIHRLVKVGVLEEAGKVVVNHEAGTWVKRYRIVDRSPDQPEGPLTVPSGQVSDQSEGPLGVPSGADSHRPDGPVGTPDGPVGTPDGPVGTPDGPPGGAHSVPLYQSLRYQSLLDAQFEIERDPNPKGQPKGASNEEGHGTDVLEITKKIGTFKWHDSANPKDRATLCVVPGCGKYNHRRTYCQTHPVSEVMPFLENAAEGGRP